MQARKKSVDLTTQAAEVTQKRSKGRNNKQDAVIQQNRVATLKAYLLAQDEREARNARIEELKARVDAGTYHVDSRTLAQKMLNTSSVWNLLRPGRHDDAILPEVE